MTVFNAKIHRALPSRLGRVNSHLIKDPVNVRRARQVAPDLRWERYLPLKERHSFLRRIEGWYSTEPISFQDWASEKFRFWRSNSAVDWSADIARLQDLCALHQLYLEASGNKKAFPRWATQVGLWDDWLFSGLWKNFVETSASVSFKISCRFDDFKRAGNSPHYGSCMSDEIKGLGPQGGYASKYVVMADPNMFLIYVPDKHGHMLWRSWGMLMTSAKGYSLMLFRKYGNGNGGSRSLARKMAELAPVYVDRSYRDYVDASWNPITGRVTPLSQATGFDLIEGDMIELSPAINAAQSIHECYVALRGKTLPAVRSWQLAALSSVTPDVHVPYFNLRTQESVPHGFEPLYKACLWFDKRSPNAKKEAKPSQAKASVHPASQQEARRQAHQDQAQEGVEQ